METLLLEDVVARALREDCGVGDLTTEAVVPPAVTGEGDIIFRSGGVVAGVPVAACAFRLSDPGVSLEPAAAEGEEVPSGRVVATVRGPVAGILRAERVALNFLGRLSGIATETRHAVRAVAGHKARILDTRKTTPNLRALERYAVRVGGGLNHRPDLGSMALIKDNHLRAAGGIAEAVRRVRARAGPSIRVEVEAETLQEVEEALAAGADVIMLDNMGLADMAEAVRRVGGRALVEASGGIRLENLPEVAGTGVDYISLGYLTTRVAAVDVSLELRP
jgi:nicotinate-nucleotide pyrophosphorylase (carboxylating)